VGALFDAYQRHGLHGRTERHRQELKRKLALWRAFLGASRPVESLSPSDVNRFVEARRLGTIRPDKSNHAAATVSNTTIWHDYVALTTALHFGTRHRNSRGKPLIVANPLNGVRVDKTVTPADDGFYEALCSTAGHLNAKFSVALDLAHSTGHRIDAILKLRWSDVNFTRTLRRSRPSAGVARTTR